MDRTVATGHRFIGQYRPAVAKMYESLETCPDDLLLFMHHVPYTHKLHSGKTVIQYIYDSHYDGSARRLVTLQQWKSLKGRIDEQPLSPECWRNWNIRRGSARSGAMRLRAGS